MAVAIGRRVTRARKTITPDDFSEKPAFKPVTRSLRSNKNVSSIVVLIEKKGNKVISKQKSKLVTAESKATEEPEKQGTRRKRARAGNEDESSRSEKEDEKMEDENVVEEEAKAEVIHFFFLIFLPCSFVRWLHCLVQ